MIQTLEIQNRQSHEHTRLDFHPGVNLIIGRGTSGKSAILRAFRWTLENPSGESQISNWIKRTTKAGKKVLDGESSVSITTPKGTLRRFRNTESNGYEINGTTLKAIGTGVPEEVQAFFNLSETNIQGQFDRPFLISMPGSQVSAYLNRVVGIEEIDKYLTASTSCIREAKKRHMALLEAQETEQKALDALSWVDGIQSSLDALTALEDQKALQESRLSLLRMLLVSIREKTAARDQVLKVAVLADRLQEAKRLSQAVSGVSSRLVSVSRTVESWKGLAASLERASRVAGLSGALEAVVALDAEVIGARARLQRLQEWRESVATAEESLAVASKVAVLSDRLQGLHRDRAALEAKETRLAGLVRARKEWVRLDAVVRKAGRVGALETGLAKVRKMAKVLDVRKRELAADRKSTRLNSSHSRASRMPSSA